jgi:hypothetical protein
MATQSWGGGVSGDWDTAGNWTSAKPGNNDTVLFPASTTRAVSSGQTDENAIDVDTLWFQEGFNANVGSSGNELTISADLLKFEGGGQLWFKAGDTVVDLAVIRARPATSGITSVYLNGTGTTDYTDMRIQRGNVAIGSNLSTVTKLWVGPDTIVSIASGSTITDYRQSGGVVTCDSTLTNAEICAGTFNLDTVVTGTTFDVYGGIANILFGGTHPLINLYGGFVDFTRSGTLKTVTTMNVYGGDYKYNELVTFTNPVNDYR